MLTYDITLLFLKIVTVSLLWHTCLWVADSCSKSFVAVIEVIKGICSAGLLLCIQICYSFFSFLELANNAWQGKFDTDQVIIPKWSRGTITCPSDLTIKMVAAARALHSSKKKNTVPSLTSLVTVQTC